MATTSAPLLSDAEQRTWRAFARSARLLFAQLDRDLSRDAGMAPGHYELLLVLSEAPRQTLRMSELADATLSSPSRISHAVERLVELGWVERTTCPSDRRGWLATLTESGMGALRSAAPAHAEHLRARLFAVLSAHDVAELGRISERVLADLPTPCPGGGGC